MTILHVVSSLNPEAGGVSQALKTIINGLSSSGVDNEVASVDAAEAEYLLNDDFTTYALGPGKTSWQYSFKLFKWLKHNIQKYDIVIIHGLWQYPGYATYKAWKSFTNKIPRLFVMPHGMLDPYFQRVLHRKLKAIRNWFYWKLVEEKLVNAADGILFTCETELLLARRTFRPYHPKKQLNVGMGVDTPPSRTSEMINSFFDKCRKIKNEPYLLFLGRIHDKKGVDLLIQAYEQVGKEIIREGKNLQKLVIAGPGIETSFGQSIKNMIDRSSWLPKYVFFPGMISGDAKWGAFYGCEAFVLPSHQENFGVAVVEALACSKAVLISDQVNIWREIKIAAGGVVANDTLEGTKQILQSWFSLKEKEKIQMGENALKVYRDQFLIKPTTKKFLDAIKH